MFCDCGKTYVVNEDGGFPYARRKKDSSFRSFITVMFFVLLVYLGIYCLILTINKNRAHDLENPDSRGVTKDIPNLESKEKLYGRLHKNVTEKVANPETSTTEFSSSVKESSITPDYETQKNREDDANWTETGMSNTTKGGIETNSTEEDKGTTTDIRGDENEERSFGAIEVTTRGESVSPLLLHETTTDFSFKNNAGDDKNNVEVYTTTYNVLNAESTDISGTTPKIGTTSRKLDVEQAKANVGSDKGNMQVETKEWKVVATTTKTYLNRDLITQVPQTDTTTIVATSLEDQPEMSVNVNEENLKTIATTNSYVDADADFNLNNNHSEKIEPTTVTLNENMINAHEITIINTVTEKQSKSKSEQSIQPAIVNADSTQKEVTTSTMRNDEKATTVLENTIEHVVQKVKSENVAEAPVVKQDIVNKNHASTSAAPDIITSASPATATYNKTENNLFNENSTTQLSVLGITENSQQNKLLPKGTKRICSSPECKGKASEILGRMDHSADPCEDFYKFSCQGGTSGEDSMRLQKAEVLLEFLYKTRTTGDLQVKSLKKFFHSCVKYENEFGYSAKIEQVTSSNIRTNNLTTLLAFLMLRQTAPLFDVRMGFVDNKEGYGLQVLPPSDFSDTDTLKGWSLQSHIEKECIRNSGKYKYEEEADLEKVYEQFEECRNKTLVKKMNDFVNLQKNGKKQKEENILPWKFLLNKAKISTAAIQKAVSNRLYKKTDVTHLNRKYSSIDWGVLFGKILCSKFDFSMPIYLYLEEAYFEPLMKDLSKRLVDKEEEILNTIKLYYQLQLYENLVSPKDDVDYFCVNQASSLMPEIAENIFVRSNPAITDDSGRLEMIFDELKEKFYWLIDISNMEEGDKNQLKKRLGLLKLSTFKMGEVKNMFVEKYHDYITSDYLSNLFMLLEDKRGVSTREDFVRNLYTTFQNFDNPKVIPNEDTIVVPNSFIYRIIKNKNTPSYVSEAYAKFHLSRAIVAYLEEVVRKFELTFHLQFQKTLNKYLEGMDVEINWKNQRLSYKNNYELWTSAIEASTSDRTADNIALQIAFGSIFPQNKSSATLPWISEDYNSEKQFFVLVVQEYCEPLSLLELAKNLFGTSNMPGVFRTDAMITNSREFETAFNCPQGSRMNPPDKVEYTNFIPDDYTNYANNYEEQLSK